MTQGNLSGQTHPVVIVGAGAVGLCAALALGRRGISSVLLGPVAETRDGRSVALLEGSMKILRSLDCDQAVMADAAPMRNLTLIDDTGSLFRAPPVTFQAAELGLSAFGHNISLVALTSALQQIVSREAHIQRVVGNLVGLVLGEDGISVQLEGGGTIDAHVVIGADGAQSPVRQAAGIAAKIWTYPQKAVTAILTHRRPHADTSTEFHKRGGPFTLVPMRENRSALVWVTKAQEADRLAEMPPADFALAAERACHSMLGAFKLEGMRGLVPMRGLSVASPAKGRVFLIGEAAHAFPPIGAQGLNLGLRDAAALADCLVAVRDRIDDPDAIAEASTRYCRHREADVRLRTGAVDLLNRSLLADFLPVDFLRGFGLHVLAHFGPLRRFIMRQGLGISTG